MFEVSIYQRIEVSYQWQFSSETVGHKPMPALQVPDQSIRPSQLQKMLGISEKGTQMLLSQFPDIAKLQPSDVISRLSALKVASTSPCTTSLVVAGGVNASDITDGQH